MIRTSVDASLEVYTANEGVDLLAVALGRAISVEAPLVTPTGRS